MYDKCSLKSSQWHNHDAPKYLKAMAEYKLPVPRDSYGNEHGKQIKKKWKLCLW